MRAVQHVMTTCGGTVCLLPVAVLTDCRYGGRRTRMCGVRVCGNSEKPQRKCKTLNSNRWGQVPGVVEPIHCVRRWHRVKGGTVRSVVRACAVCAM